MIVVAAGTLFVDSEKFPEKCINFINPIDFLITLLYNYNILTKGEIYGRIRKIARAR